MTAWGGAVAVSGGAVPSTYTGGVLTSDAHTPLTLHGCDVCVHVRGCSAHVTLRHEYVNRGANNVRVVALHPLPLTWQLMSCEVMYEGKRVVAKHDRLQQQQQQQQQQQHTSRYAVDATACVCAVQHVPWAVLLDSSVLLTSTYTVDLSAASAARHGAQSAHHFAFVLPAELLQMLHTHASDSVDEGGNSNNASHTYATHFALQSPPPRTLARGLVVRVTGALLTPLRSHVTLRRRCYHCSSVAASAAASYDILGGDNSNSDDDEDATASAHDTADAAVASATACVRRAVNAIAGTATATTDDDNKASTASASLPCHVEYAGDSCFVLQYADATAAVRRRWRDKHSNSSTTTWSATRAPCCVCGGDGGVGGYGELLLRCRVYVSDEPLRLFVERKPAHTHTSKNTTSATAAAAAAADDDGAKDAAHAVALAICLTPKLSSCDVNAEVVFVLDTHTAAAACAVADALRLTLPSLPPSVRVNVVLAGNTLRHVARCATMGSNGSVTDRHGSYSTTAAATALRDEADDGCVYRAGSRCVRDVDVEALCALVRMRAHAGLQSHRADDQDGSGSAVAAPEGGDACDAARLLDVLCQVWRCNGTCSCGSVPDGYVRHVVLLSDGSVAASKRSGGEGDGDAAAAALFAEAARHTTTTRISAVAVCLDANSNSSSDDDGDDSDGDAAVVVRATHTLVDTTLLRLLAREGAGVYAAAHTSSQLLRALARVLYAAAVPALTDVRVHCSTASATATTASASQALCPAFALGSDERLGRDARVLPVVTYGTLCCLYALADAAVTQVTVHVTGKVGAAVVEYVGTCAVPMPQNNNDDSQDSTTRQQQQQQQSLLHNAAAAARIAYLCEPAGGVANAAGAAEVTALSCAFALPSPYTQLMQEQQQQQDNNNKSTAVDKAYALPVCTPRVAVQVWYSTRASCCGAALRRGRIAQQQCCAAHVVTASPSAAAAASGVPAHMMTHNNSSSSTCDADDGSTVSCVRALLWRTVAHVLRTTADVRVLLALQQQPSGLYALDYRLCLQLRHCSQRLHARTTAAAAAAKTAGDTTCALDVLHTTLCTRQPSSCPSRGAWATSLALAAMTMQWPDTCALARHAAVRALQRVCAQSKSKSDKTTSSSSSDNDSVWHEWVDAAARLLLVLHAS